MADGVRKCVSSPNLSRSYVSQTIWRRGVQGTFIPNRPDGSCLQAIEAIGAAVTTADRDSLFAASRPKRLVSISFRGRRANLQLMHGWGTLVRNTHEVFSVIYEKTACRLLLQGSSE